MNDLEDEDDLPTREQSGASGSVWTGSANPVALALPTVGEEDQVCITLAKQITHLRTEVAKYEQGTDYESVDEGNEGHPALPVTACVWASTHADQDQPMQTDDESSESEAVVLERLQKARILSSTSSKLNYVISQVLRHCASEKCIVFCQSRTAMYYIHEYLSLAKVRCRMYHTQGMTEKERSNTIMTFNTSEMVSTIIMDTKHAAFGIDLSSASRVYFVSPVWQTATMRQAVKRAHRIGQTRPVYVETLVIRNSFEEAILDRRLELDNVKRSQATRKGKERQVGEVAGEEGLDAASSGSGISRASRSMVDDRKMRDLISHIDFMPLPAWAALTTDPPSSSAYPVLAGGSSSGGRGSMPLDGYLHDQQHLYSTLEDYARLDGDAPDLSFSALDVPVIFPSKRNDLAARRQPHVAHSQHVSTVDPPLALDIQQRQQTGEQQDDDAIQEAQDPRELQDEQRTVQWSFWQSDPQGPTIVDDQGADSSMELNPDDVEGVDNTHLDYETQWKEDAMPDQQSGEAAEGLPTIQLNRMKLEEWEELKAEVEAEDEIKVEPYLELEHNVKGEGRLKTEPEPVAVWTGVKQEIKTEEDAIKQEDLRIFPKVEPEHFVLFDLDDDREWKQELEQEVMTKHEEGSVQLPLKDEPAPLLATKRSPEDVARNGSPLVKSEASVKRVRFC